ncbi:MAG: hypothetical protein WAK98_03680 [Gemmobacter sp.]
MTWDQIIAFGMALAGPPPVDPLVPIIASGGEYPRYRVVSDRGDHAIRVYQFGNDINA